MAKSEKKGDNDPQLNESRQGVDKMPSEEKEKKEKVTPDDLKGKKVDGDPTKEEDQPLSRKYSK
jgi:hypothetical protein